MVSYANSKLSQAINNNSKSSLSNPTPSADNVTASQNLSKQVSIAQSNINNFNQANAGNINSNGSGGGPVNQQTSFFNPTPEATSGMTINPVTNQVQGPTRQTQKNIDETQRSVISPSSSPTQKASLGVWGDTGYIGSNGWISPFQHNQAPFLNPYEAGVKENFFGTMKNFFNTGTIPYGDEIGNKVNLPKTNKGGTRTDMGMGLNGGIFITPTPTTETLSARAKSDYIIKDVGTPVEFKIQDLGETLSKEAESKYKAYGDTIALERIKQDVELQNNIYFGKITVDEAKTYQKGLIDIEKNSLDLYGTKLNEDYKTTFNNKVSDLISSDSITRNEVMGNLNAARSRNDLVPVIETGLIFAGPIIGEGIATSYAASNLGISASINELPMTASVGSRIAENIVFGGLGSKDIVQGMYRNDMVQTASGVASFGFVGLTSSNLPKSIQEANREYDLMGLSTKSFDIKNSMFELRQVGNIDTSQVLGTRSFGDMTQVLYSKGDIEKQGSEFIMNGKMDIVTGGTIKGSEIYDFGKQVNSKAFSSLQEFNIGSEGATLKFAGTKTTSLTLGKGELIPTFETSSFTDIKYSNEPTIKLYHGTSDALSNDMLKYGINPKEGFNEVFTTSSKDFASGFAGTRVAKEGFLTKPVVLEIEMPISKFNELKVNRASGIGGFDEVPLKSVSSEYIKGSESFGNFKYSYNKQDLLSGMKSNVKYFKDIKYNTPIGGVTTKVGKNLYKSRIGDVTGISSASKEFDISGGIVKVDSNIYKVDMKLKDYVITKTTPKRASMKEFEVYSSGSDLGLKSFQEGKIESSIITKGLSDSFKSKLIPMQTSGVSFKSSELVGSFKSLGTQDTKVITKEKSKYSSSYYNPLSSSLDVVQGSQLKSGSYITPTTKSFQTQISKQDLVLKQPSMTMQDLSLKQADFNIDMKSNFIGSPVGNTFGNNYNGFGLPSIPELGGGLGYSPRKPKKNKRIKQKTRPSFTAEVFDLKIGMPKSGKMGTNPFSIRGLPKNSKSFNLGI